MKTQTIVTEITLDDLVNLIATAWEGSNWLGFDIPLSSGIHVPRVEDECREDRMARVLLAGYSIFVKDYYAEDENDFYGNLKHFWNKDCMAYELTLEDIKKGIGRAMDNGGYIRDYINHWADDECMDFDLTEAEAVMQWIVFGEEIYG
jgi:hypothetical protein